MSNPIYLTLLSKLKSFLISNKSGTGIERAMYELSPYAPCLYAPLKNEYIIAFEQLIDRLEHFAQTGKKVISMPMDRHLLSFMAARSPKELKTYFHHLASSTDTSKNILSILKIFAYMQQQKKHKKYPYLTKQFIPFSNCIGTNVPQPQAKRKKNCTIRKIL